NLPKILSGAVIQRAPAVQVKGKQDPEPGQKQVHEVNGDHRRPGESFFPDMKRDGRSSADQRREDQGQVRRERQLEGGDQNQKMTVAAFSSGEPQPVAKRQRKKGHRESISPAHTEPSREREGQQEHGRIRGLNSRRPKMRKRARHRKTKQEVG